MLFYFRWFIGRCCHYMSEIWPILNAFFSLPFGCYYYLLIYFLCFIIYQCIPPLRQVHRGRPVVVGTDARKLIHPCLRPSPPPPPSTHPSIGPSIHSSILSSCASFSHAEITPKRQRKRDKREFIPSSSSICVITSQSRRSYRLGR